ncbi:MAG: PAC2 family protein, partial [Micromonosporaceae bacterium]
MTEFDGLPVLTDPVVVAAFEGWNDAADAATAAVEHLEELWQSRPAAELDPDGYYDFQVTRPMISMVDGDQRRIEWPTTRFSVCRPPGTERDVVLIRGIEPNVRWRAFCDDVLEVCHSLAAEKLVLLGALLADVPYTRPLPVSGSSSDEAMIERLGLAQTKYEGPTG